MKKILGILILGLLWCNISFAGGYVKSAYWKNGDAAHNDCGFTGIFCTMSTKNVKANRNSISLGQNIIIYSNGKQIDSFTVQRIYYDSKTGQCWISKQRKEKFKDYFVTYNCRGV